MGPDIARRTGSGNPSTPSNCCIIPGEHVHSGEFGITIESRTERPALKIQNGVTDTIDMTGMFSQQHLLTNALSVLEQNHELLSQNIANVNTPGYRTRQLQFQNFLEQVEDGTANRKLLDELSVELQRGLKIRKDGNNVDLDSQVGELKKGSLLFQTYSHLLASKMATARRAMSR